MLSSLLEVDRAGMETPMTSAESRRVERDEQRRWWDPRFTVVTGAELSCDSDEMEQEEDESETS
jgi:hypothetical protein